MQWFVLHSRPCLACVLAFMYERLWCFMCAYFQKHRYVCVCVFLVRNVFPSVCVCVCPKSPSTSDEPGEESKEGCVQVCPVTLLLSVLYCSYALSGLLCTKVWGASREQQEHCIQTIVKHGSTEVLLGKRMILCVQVCMWHCACVWDHWTRALSWTPSWRVRPQNDLRERCITHYKQAPLRPKPSLKAFWEIIKITTGMHWF